MKESSAPSHNEGEQRSTSSGVWAMAWQHGGALVYLNEQTWNMNGKLVKWNKWTDCATGVTLTFSWFPVGVMQHPERRSGSSKDPGASFRGAFSFLLLSGRWILPELSIHRSTAFTHFASLFHFFSANGERRGTKTKHVETWSSRI